MIAREVLAIRALSGLTHVSVTALPAMLHFQPDRICDAVASAAENARQAGAVDILVGYADCGTGGRLKALCESRGLELLPGPHCFAIYGAESGQVGVLNEAKDEPGAFYVTDFLARQPDAFLWRPLGLDRHPDLAATYFSNYRAVVHLAQTEDEALDRSAREIARRLGLSYERRATGYGALPELLTAWAGGASTTTRRGDGL